MSFSKDEKVTVLRLGLPDTEGTVVDPVPNVFGCVVISWISDTMPDGIELRRVGKVHINNIMKLKEGGVTDNDPNLTFKKEKLNTRFFLERQNRGY